MGDVVQFPMKPTEPKVELMRNEDGRFIIVCDYVQVFGPFDVIGQRELIRKASLWDSSQRQGEEGKDGNG